MSKHPLLRSLALGTALLAAGTPSTASAVAAPTNQASGDSKVTVTVPDVIILDYFTKIDLALASQTESHSHASYTKTNVGGADQTIDGNGALTTSTLTDADLDALKGSDITLTLKNAWAVRGFSSDGKATVSIKGDKELKKDSSDSTIGVSKLQVATDGVTAGESISASLNGIQKGNATLGDILLGLNFTNTSASGDYTGKITITAVTL